MYELFACIYCFFTIIELNVQYQVPLNWWSVVTAKNQNFPKSFAVDISHDVETVKSVFGQIFLPFCIIINVIFGIMLHLMEMLIWPAYTFCIWFEFIFVR